MNEQKCSVKYCRNEIEIKYLGEWLCEEHWQKKSRGESNVV